MEKKYWEKIAPNYETEIFDVLKNDVSGKIVKSILSFANKKKTIYYTSFWVESIPILWWLLVFLNTLQ